MITAKTAREMLDKALENRMMESKKRIEREIRKAAAKGESAAYIDWPIPQELIAELRANGFHVESSFCLNDTTYAISW